MAAPMMPNTFGGSGLDTAPAPQLSEGFIPSYPPAPAPHTDEQLLAIFDRYKREAMEYRWVWEREWLRDLFYIANRQWITYHPTRREWVDKRLQKWMPRPVTNKMAETLSAIRTNFAAINLGVKARPLGTDVQSIAAAEIAEQMAPLIHEEHNMDQVMREADFWFVATGNACLQVSWDRDPRFNKTFVQSEQCVSCGQVMSGKQIVDAENRCPHCGQNTFIPAQNPDGSPLGQSIAFGRGKTSALSPFEYAFASNQTRWDELPYIIRMRWRDKHWFEANRPDLVPKITWEKAPTDRSLQIFKSLAVQNDVGTGSHFSYLGTAGSNTVEGVTEYEIWIRPNKEFPKGWVMRVLGDQGPQILHLEDTEAIPGPIPYVDIEGNPLFPFLHAQYEHMGGRLYGRSAISPLIQKQDQLNQLDSLAQLCLQRMANPVWVVPEGAGIGPLTGEPGLLVTWNPLLAGGSGAARPTREPGMDIPQSIFALRTQILADIEALSGTFDIFKGQKPAGVEAFSAIQALIERSQSRFIAAQQARGEMYRGWFAIAIELERAFGPEQRVRAIVGNNKGYTFKHFANAQLQGQITIQIEDGTNVPKTSLGKRAAIEQANNMKLLDTSNPEQRQALLTTFGLSDLSPSLNYHINTSATIQDQFERWAVNPIGPSPLKVKPWYDVQIHWTERIKWLNTDKMRELLDQNSALEPIVSQHLLELQYMMAPPADPLTGLPAMQGPVPPGSQPQAPPEPQGTGMAMANSNRESGAIDTLPKGAAETGPNRGPA
jgi:predicted RNA-binding Zn-ribbon protein involved in translation (DUF1610 family)